MPATETFGASLRRLRIAAGLTQERLAERSGISAAGVAALEAGRRNSPRLTTVGLLCDALGVDPAQRAALIATARGEGARPAAPSTTDRRSIEVPPAPQRRQRTFVGRFTELQVLRDAWERRARVALVAGEAGVGKTTLATGFAAELADHGVSVLTGRSTPHRLGVFESFVEPIRSAVGRYGDAVPPELGDLGRLVSGRAPGSAEPLMPSRADPEVERRLLFEAVVDLFGSNGPTMVFLDDLHWADPGTLAMLSFLAASDRLTDVLFVATVRSTDVTTSTSAALADLRRRCVVVSVSLGGLSRTELAELVSEVAGDDTSDGLIDAVSEATNGNPLFIRELTEHLLRRSIDQADASPIVPAGIRQTIDLRVETLSADAQRLLRSGAVLGQRFDLPLAGQMAGLDGEALIAAAEDALLSGLVVEQSATSVSFSHGLVSSAIYESTSQLRRLALHRAAATALAERQPVAAGEIVDVARHWEVVAASDLAARTTAARWSARAGVAAAAAASVDEAITCFERAIATWDEPSTEFADTLVRLGSSLIAVGRLAEGKAHLTRALQVADQIGDTSAFARAALGLSASVRYTQSDPERIAELEAAIERLDPSEMILRPALLATLRRQLGFVVDDRAEARRREAAAAVAAAVSSPDVSDELLISLGSLRDSLVVDDPEPLGRLARDIIRVATARQDLPVLSTGWYRQAWAALELGEAARFREAVAEYRTIAERLRRPYELALSSNMLAAVAQIEGRFDDAEAAGQEALAHAAAIDDGNFAWVYFANSGLRAHDAGAARATFELMTAARAEFASLDTFEAGYAAMAAAVGERDLLCELFERQIGHDGEIVDRNWWYLSAERLPVVGMWAWACGMDGDVRRAAVVRDRLARIGDLGVRVVRIAPVGAWIGPLDHHLGALSRVIGDLDRAEQLLQRALLVEDEMGGRPYTVRTLAELAACARARGGPTGAARAAELLERAGLLAAELGLESILATCP
ncbi:MAG: AAA family ATPase [Acidimicrobiales bacterium]|nr:AAA family ATPase [Acidimicrobiales bacterium]